MSDEARNALASRAPVSTCEGRLLSAFHCCLVASQQPDATVVGGFRQWRAVGRQVRKGAHRCAIFVPTHHHQEGGGSELDETRFVMVTVALVHNPLLLEPAPMQ